MKNSGSNLEIKDGDLTYRIIGCAMRVHSALGPGLREKPYENALAVDFEVQGIQFKQQPSFLIYYLERRVGDCQPDLLVEEEVVVDCKSIPAIGDNEIGQMLNYLRITERKVGLIVNFRNGSLEHKRVQR